MPPETAATTNTETSGTSSNEGVAERSSSQAGTYQTPSSKGNPSAASVAAAGADPKAADLNTSAEGNEGADPKETGEPNIFSGVPQESTESAEQNTETEKLFGNDPTADEGTEWLNSLDEKYRSEPSINKYSSMDQLAEGMINLSKMRGTDQNNIPQPPTASSTDEEKAAWNEFAGIPNESGQYEVPQAIKDMDAEDLQHFYGKEGFEGLLPTFHKMGLNQSQVDQVSALYQDAVVGLAQRGLDADSAFSKQEYTDTVTQLKQEYGPNYHANMKSIDSTAQKLDVMEEATKLGFVNNIHFARMIHKINTGLGESNIDGTTGAASSQSFQDKLNELDRQVKSGDISKKAYAESRSEMYKNRNINIGRQPK